MSTELFKTPDQGEDTGVDLSSVTEQDAFKLLVGEGAKYKSPEALAKAALFKDEHLKKLEQENRELRAKTSEQKTLADLIAKLNTTPAVKTPEQTEQKMGESPKTEIDIEAKIRAAIAAELEKVSGTNTRSQNIASVTETLQANWGADYQQVLAAKAKALGVSEQHLTELAATQPKVFLSAVGADQKRSTDGAPIPSSFNPSRTSREPVKNYAFYSEIRKTNPRLYYTHAIQKEMMDASAKLGDAFFNK